MAALAIIAGCADRTGSPLSPSALSSLSSEGAPRGAVTLAPRRVDEDGDGYEDPDQPQIPGQPLPPDGVPIRVQLTINVVSSFGIAAFVPNPLHAAIGNTIVWTNTDLVPHDIVLDDGRPVGMLLPGQSSLPIALATETTGYHCTFHPTMVGQVTPMPTDVPLPLPTDPSQVPPAGPAPAPPPYDYGGDDGGSGYDDYDYY